MILQQRPFGFPDEHTWSFTEENIREPQQGEMLIGIQYISLDPAMRGWISKGKSYIPPVEVGAVMRAGTVGEVLTSQHPDYSPGDIVVGTLGVQQLAISNGKGLIKIDPRGLPLTKFLSVLGMTGMTAYFGLLEIGQPKKGDTLVVSGAAGAVGSVVGQIGKIKGCKVVGIAGGKEKCDYLIEGLGFDAAIDYKNNNVKQELRKACPDGIDIYFDNVGGDILDTVLTQINLGARISLCGAISQYNNTTPIKGPSNYLSLLVNRAKMEGFIVFDFAKDYGKAMREMSHWIITGKLQSEEYVVEGIENFYPAFCRLFSGEKRGKLMLQV